MKRRKLKNFVLPSLYVMVIGISIFTIGIVNSFITKPETNYEFAKPILKEPIKQVLNEVEDPKIVKPYTSDSVTIKTGYYSKDDENKKQESALILYQNTYMPSSGIIYTSKDDKPFEVVCALDGEIKSVAVDPILGTVIEISHNSNLTTYYYSLKNVTLKQGEYVTSGTKLGNSSENKLVNTPSLLFEVYYQGKSMNPEKFYEMDLKELQ